MLIPLISVLLLALSVCLWTAVNSNMLNYQSIATSQQQSQQFALAEYVLMQAQNWLRHTPIASLPKPVQTCIQSPCIVIAQPANYFPQQVSSWWLAADNFTVVAVQADISHLHAAFYTIEELIESRSFSARYFRFTSWALLSTQTRPSIVQMVWRKSLKDGSVKPYAWRQWK